jgi:hypothetical protein
MQSFGAQTMLSALHAVSQAETSADTPNHKSPLVSSLCLLYPICSRWSFSSKTPDDEIGSEQSHGEFFGIHCTIQHPVVVAFNPSPGLASTIYSASFPGVSLRPSRDRTPSAASGFTRLFGGKPDVVRKSVELTDSASRSLYACLGCFGPDDDDMTRDSSTPTKLMDSQPGGISYGQSALNNIKLIGVRGPWGPKELPATVGFAYQAQTLLTSEAMHGKPPQSSFIGFAPISGKQRMERNELYWLLTCTARGLFGTREATPNESPLTLSAPELHGSETTPEEVEEDLPPLEQAASIRQPAPVPAPRRVVLAAEESTSAQGFAAVLNAMRASSEKEMRVDFGQVTVA